MATKRTAPAPVETTTVAEPTHQQIVNDGIAAVVTAHGIDGQKNRYKAMRAIAWQAFVESIEAGDFEALVQRAIANVGTLPAGWEAVQMHRAFGITAPAPVITAMTTPARKATR